MSSSEDESYAEIGARECVEWSRCNPAAPYGTQRERHTQKAFFLRIWKRKKEGKCGERVACLTAREWSLKLCMSSCMHVNVNCCLVETLDKGADQPSSPGPRRAIQLEGAPQNAGLIHVPVGGLNPDARICPHRAGQREWTLVRPVLNQRCTHFIILDRLHPPP